MRKRENLDLFVIFLIIICIYSLFICKRWFFYKFIKVNEFFVSQPWLLHMENRENLDYENIYMLWTSFFMYL